ncbi:glutamate receptor ionotropic, delta-1-like [Procambarus clarkii]|uniref:glutamate receptor ionotropic, delta-1-like n=1 Tax=Procambarus clarkii TaxID=6728 RepID=UPI001E67414F|nr:glutamate receptor ionotropic, delta-1-like [Procambarus clarkii]
MFTSMVVGLHLATLLSATNVSVLLSGLPVRSLATANLTLESCQATSHVTQLRCEVPVVQATAPPAFRFQEAVILRVAAEEWVPHIRVMEDPPGNVTISGPMANLLQTLADALHFRYTLVRPPDGAWGIPTSGGDWNGMIGMVKRNEADLALGPFGLTYSRSRVVDFSSPILIDYYRILVRRPRSEPEPLGFLMPFRWAVWVVLVACVGVVGVVLYYVSMTYHLLGRGGVKIPGSEHLLLSHCWTVYSALLGAPFMWKVERGVERVVVATWCIMSMIVARSYSSALTSLLAVRTVPVKYNYLRQIIDDHKINLIFEKATALVEHMSTVQQGIYKDLADTNLTGRAHFLPSSKLYDAAYNKVRNKPYALLVEETTCNKVYSDDFSKYGRCDFYIGKELYWPLIFGMIGRKGSPFLPAISDRMERLASHNLYFKWLADELPNATACLRASTRVTTDEAYSLQGLWGVFVLFTGGMLMAAVVMLCEMAPI